jgi:predicted carbohydrate-binding protein with CBM5 and CBM33 domain
MQHENAMPCQEVGHICSSQKKAFATYRWHTHSRWQFTLISVVSSNETTYENVVSVPTEKYNIYKIHHYLSPKWCPHV